MSDAVRNPDVLPVLISARPPEYPEVASKAKIHGVVILEIVIDEEGRVSAGRVLKPLPFGLDQAAMEAVRTWKYKPASHRGRVVRTIRHVTVIFPPQSLGRV